ncbi:MAG: acyl-CoA carboxylase subunit epsilon [Jatrophihabitantaceae bacterium]
MNEAVNEVAAPPVLRIVRGTPTAEELAVVTALVTAASAGGGAGGPDITRRGRWNDPFAAHRRPWLHGSGAWRAFYR